MKGMMDWLISNPGPGSSGTGSRTQCVTEWCGAQADRPGTPGQISQAAGLAYHRYGRVFHLGIQRLPHSEGL